MTTTSLCEVVTIPMATGFAGVVILVHSNLAAVIRVSSVPYAIQVALEPPFNIW